MQRVVEQLSGIHDLDQVAQVHNADAVRNMADNSQVMRHKNVGKAQFFLQVSKQVDDLRLDGNVQGRNRLVADDQLRVARQRAGNTQALTLAAGHFMRVTVSHHNGVQVHKGHQLIAAFPDFRLSERLTVSAQAVPCG